jgi:hypothetical protein
MAGILVDPSAVVPGKGHHLIIDATAPMPPDPIGIDAEMVRPPSGKEIDELFQMIQNLQEAKR